MVHVSVFLMRLSASGDCSMQVENERRSSDVAGASLFVLRAGPAAARMGMGRTSARCGRAENRKFRWPHRHWAAF